MMYVCPLFPLDFVVTLPCGAVVPCGTSPGPIWPSLRVPPALHRERSSEESNAFAVWGMYTMGRKKSWRLYCARWCFPFHREQRWARGSRSSRWNTSTSYQGQRGSCSWSSSFPGSGDPLQYLYLQSNISPLPVCPMNCRFYELLTILWLNQDPEMCVCLYLTAAVVRALCFDDPVEYKCPLWCSVVHHSESSLWEGPLGLLWCSDEATSACCSAEGSWLR